MPAKPVQVGDLHFEKKGDAVQYFQDMLNGYQLGDKVSSEDTSVLRSLICMHPDYKVKAGLGIASFSVRSADFGTRCFWINRVDGSTEKFSFRSCL